MIFENGGHQFKIEVKYILRFDETKRFYHIRLAITGADEEVRNALISPIVPIRAASTSGIERLTETLHIDFRKRHKK